MATQVEETTAGMRGARMKRVEDPGMITGTAKYIDDLKLAGMAHVAILRSPYAHARIKGIDTAKAEAQPGVIAVYTGRDFEHLPPLPCAWQATGTENFVATPRALELDRVTFTGAGVAAVVAETKTAAEDALALIEVDWEPLEVVVDVERAVEEGAPQLHEVAERNIVMDWHCGDAEATEKALGEADVVVEQRLVNQRLLATPMDVRGAAATYEPATGEYTVWMTSQCPHIMSRRRSSRSRGFPGWTGSRRMAISSASARSRRTRRWRRRSSCGRGAACWRRQPRGSATARCAAARSAVASRTRIPAPTIRR
jgi:aerobic carbon-monoxide dehydrogenase large subunit